MNALDTDLLHTFVAVADNGGFTRAADVVHRTQSAISMQMRRLEKHVGVALFERSGRNLVLTSEGEQLLTYARRILTLHREALASLQQPDLTGLVRIGTPDDYVMRFLPSILARFAQTYPRVQVEVRCEPSTQLLDTLANGELDLALVTRDGDVVGGEVVRREQTVWASSKHHFVHEQDPLPLALFPKGCFFRGWAFRSLDAIGKDYRVAYTSPSITGIQAAVSAGLAVTVLGRSILPIGVRQLTADEGFPELPAATVTLKRASEKPSPAIDSMAKHIVDSFRDDEPEDVQQVLNNTTPKQLAIN